MYVPPDIKRAPLAGVTHAEYFLMSINCFMDPCKEEQYDSMVFWRIACVTCGLLHGKTLSTGLGLFCVLVKEFYGTQYQSGFLFLN